MIWFTSDTHFGHRAMIGLDGHGGWRTSTFSSLEEMDETLIKNWNEKVRRGDIVYHLGDFSFHGLTKTVSILSRLNGQIHLVRGNHDKIVKNSLVKALFTWVGDYKRISPKMAPAGLRQPIAMCHYPMVTWHGSSRGAWMLHGHSHGNLVLPYPMDKSPLLDVGVDVHNMAPISLDEVVELMRGRVYVPIDHHGTNKDYENGSSQEEA